MDVVKGGQGGRAVVWHDGHVHWEPGGLFHTMCDVNVRFFPFDTQVCHVEIGAWTYHSHKLNLTTAANPILKDNYVANSQWDLVTAISNWGDTGLPCCPGTTYPKVTFTLSLQRKSTYYLVNMVCPSVLLSLVALVVLWVPAETGEKVCASVSVLLTFTLFILSVGDMLPTTSLHTPIIGLYFPSATSLIKYNKINGLYEFV